MAHGADAVSHVWNSRLACIPNRVCRWVCILASVLPASGLSEPLTDGSARRDGCETEGNHLITRGRSFAASRQLLHGAARGNANRTNAAAWAKASALQKTSAPAPQAHVPMPMQDSWRRWKRRSGMSATGMPSRRRDEW
ncbi:conserved hypothetical protein [Xanthomonas citri pv. fuscans]|uniref:Uncharacterized protein n=1 Tax=Xanthomonas campestris pv. phaseoli TaxID=317013 RepID=A0A7Z7NH03_XANCH|nr:conserved hypothetical protein [Xanthomonas citri pv. fuscans]SOO23191.1 conserved hypothetical protein [Xanthomonas phaseoli pv. phaseoli]